MQNLGAGDVGYLVECLVLIYNEATSPSNAYTGHSNTRQQSALQKWRQEYHKFNIILTYIAKKERKKKYRVTGSRDEAQ